jgi:heme exporter protein A
VIAAIEVEALSLARGERRLFEGLSFRLSSGEALALTGPNGAGKTSLLRAIAGFIAPSAGAIRFAGRQGALDAGDARRIDTHFLGHEDALKPGRLALHELLFQARWTGGSPARALEAAERLGLARALQLAVRRLSAGQRRRLALARLIASARSLWLLDEPLAPLDAATRSVFGEAMADHLVTGGLVVAAVHDPLPIPARALSLAG